MARAKRPTGDLANNARKRYYRDAERYLRQAENSTGATAARYRSMAQKRLNEALNTYTKSTTQNFAKPIQNIANQLGVDLNEARDKLRSRSAKQEKQIRSRAIDETQSLYALRGSRDPETLRQREARALFNSPIGSRIIGGTVEIWQDKATVTMPDGSTQIDKSKILPALYEYFEVDNLADLLNAIETMSGEDLYKSPDDEAFYESVKITIQTMIAENEAR